MKLIYNKELIDISKTRSYSGSTECVYKSPICRHTYVFDIAGNFLCDKCNIFKPVHYTIMYRFSKPPIKVCTGFRLDSEYEILF